jgi:APA family basic amino acid/polyamine antiporter
VDDRVDALETKVSLKQGLTIVDVISIGIGSAVGVSIFSIMGPATKIAGPGMLPAIALAAIPMIVFAVVYAFMGSTVPRTGASFDWPSQFVHPFVGFVVAWLRVIGNIGALTVLTLVLVGYASRVMPLPQKPAMFGLLVIFSLTNLFGVKIVAGVERILVAFKLVAFALFVALGFRSVQHANFQPMVAMDWRGIFASLPLLISLYMGLESATEVGEEIRNGAAVIARGLSVAVVLTIAVYVSVSTVALGVLGSPALAGSNAPLFDAGGAFLGRLNTPVILVAAVASIGTSINAIYLTFTRFLFAMGRDGVLPASFAKIHPRWQTPHVAVATVLLLGAAGLLLPSNLVFLFLAVSVPMMLKYVSACWSAWRLVEQHPELHATARFALSARAVKAWSAAGIVFGLVLLGAGLTADWRPYAILAAWFGVGCVYWVSHGRGLSRAMQQRQAEATEPAVARVRRSAIKLVTDT